MANILHPDHVLAHTGNELPKIASCVHYAGSEKFIRKAFALQRERSANFDVCCDLEDGAAAGAEVQTAELFAKLLAGPENLRNAAGVRIHPPGSALWERELDILLSGAGKQIKFITIPKPESACEVRAVANAVEKASVRYGLPKPPPLHVLIETLSALREVWEIASIKGLEALEFGIMDFVSAHRGAISIDSVHSPAQFDHMLLARAKTEIVAAALTHDLIPSHSPTFHFSKLGQTEQDARRAKQEFGFLRMWSIHPSQIEEILKGMQPSAGEIEQACRILLRAQACAWGPINVEGMLFDRAHFRYYWRLLKETPPHLLPPEARQAFALNS